MKKIYNSQKHEKIIVYIFFGSFDIIYIKIYVKWHSNFMLSYVNQAINISKLKNLDKNSILLDDLKFKI